jgi:hypothetical protein
MPFKELDVEANGLLNRLFLTSVTMPKAAFVGRVTAAIHAAMLSDIECGSSYGSERSVAEVSPMPNG